MALKINISGEVFSGNATVKGKNGVYSVNSSEMLHRVLSDNPDEREVRIDINSVGGSVYEGLAIFDILRTSGRDIHTNIIGGCHSIAVIILLAAPLKNRSSNPNSRSLIHRVRIDPGEAKTGPELSEYVESVLREEERIIQIYTERTKLNNVQARKLIETEKTHTAQDLLKLGFISKINSYTTNSLNNKKMVQKKKKEVTILDRICGFLANAAMILSPANFDYADADGVVLFSTASEEDDLAVGSEVSFPDDTTDGTFDLPDGRVVTIENLIVTAIEDAANDGSEEIEALQAENSTLREQLTEAVNLIEEMKTQIGSTYRPKNRVGSPSVQTRTVKTAAKTAQNNEDLKNALREARLKGFANRGLKKTTV
jgi:ATP-dependent Clp protease protease subunit